MKITILFEKSQTKIGKIGRLISNYPYTHISYTLDNLNYYSFSRRYHNNPFDSGFTNEKENYYAYKNDVGVKVYTLDIGQDKIDKINKLNEKVKDKVFDIYGMILMPFNIYRENNNAYNCMSYMALIFEILEIPLINNPYYKNNIQDLENALINYGIKGENKTLKYKYDENYMRKFNKLDIVKSFIHLNKEIFKR